MAPSNHTPAFRRLCPSVVALVAGVVLAGPALALDPFGTLGVMHKDLGGIQNPMGGTCKEPGMALTLSAAVDIALCRNPATRIVWAQAREQAAALGQAESAWLPSLTATGSDGFMKGPHQQSDGAIVPGTQRTLDAAVNLSWTLYDFGGRGGRIAAARSLLDAASLAANRTLQQTVAGVVQGYYGVVAADGNVQAAKTNESATARALEVARAKRGAGVVTLADVLQAETAYQQAVLARVQAEGTATSNRGGLAVAMGLPADRVLAVAAEPVPSEAPTLTARISDLLAEAARQRPDLAAARAARDAAQADVTVARSTGLPSITIGASHNYVNQQNVLPRENYNTVGVNVNVPLFSGFSVAYGVRQAKATLDEKEADVEQVRLQVSLDVWDGYHGLESANEQLKVSQALLKAALENQDVAIGRYEAGVATIVDVLTAQAAAATARVQRVSAEYNWELARAQLALALGRLTSAEPLSDAALQ